MRGSTVNNCNNYVYFLPSILCGLIIALLGLSLSPNLKLMDMLNSVHCYS